MIYIISLNKFYAGEYIRVVQIIEIFILQGNNSITLLQYAQRCCIPGYNLFLEFVEYLENQYSSIITIKFEFSCEIISWMEKISWALSS